MCTGTGTRLLRNVTFSSLASGTHSANTGLGGWWAEGGRRVQSLASADPSAGRRKGGEWKRRVEKCSRKLGLRPPALLMNVLCMSLGNWHRVCISKKTLRVSAVELGRHKALRMVYNSVGRALRKTRVWCLLVPMLAQHPSSRAGGRMCLQSWGTHSARERLMCGWTDSNKHGKGTRHFGVSDGLFQTIKMWIIILPRKMWG